LSLKEYYPSVYMQSLPEIVSFHKPVYCRKSGNPVDVSVGAKSTVG